MSRGELFFGWTLIVICCAAIALVLFALGHWLLGSLWVYACIRKWYREARGLSTMLVWILSVQLVAGGPVYRFPVTGCAGFNHYVEQLLAWDQRSGIPVTKWGAAGCAWWDELPPELQDVAARGSR